MIIKRGNQSTQRKTCLSVSYSNTNSAWTRVESNRDLHGDRTATNPSAIEQPCQKHEMLFHHCFQILTFQYTISKVQENHEWLKLNGTQQLLLGGTDVQLLGKITQVLQRETQKLLTSIKEAGQKVKKMLRKYMLTYHPQNVEHNHKMKVANISIKNFYTWEQH